MAERLALLSVTDKSGLVEFAHGLVERGFALLSSGGTARLLREHGLEVTGVSEFTGSPEILGGRVKTLHPRVHGGILARGGHEGDDADLKERDIPAIDLVVVNLYRFEEAMERYLAQSGEPTDGPRTADDAGVLDVLEQIDIGGPTLIRAAAKNAGRVGIVVDPSDYGPVLEALDGGALSATLRTQLAAKAFRRVAAYDLAIDAFFRRVLDRTVEPNAEELVSGELGALDVSALPHALRYGENPHQPAFAVVRDDAPGEPNVLHASVLNGKALSYNNLLDAEAALELVKEFAEPTAVVVKHNNPCGTAVRATLAEAFQAAWDGDPLSAFGGILALNRPLDVSLAKEIATPSRFLEVLIAPSIDDDALKVLQTGAKWGKNLRVLACGTMVPAGGRVRWTTRSLVGGLLVQERDLAIGDQRECVTRRQPTEKEAADLEIAWRITKHVRSNAIVFVRDGALVGCGAGQMSRVDSVHMAVRKAGDRTTGAVMGSDAFFPFRDGVDLALEAGITAVIQPGGSRRDSESIAACDEKSAAMVTTGERHFRH